MAASSAAVARGAHLPLRRFGQLAESERGEVFFRPPAAIRTMTCAQTVGAALGGVLYSPATNTMLGSRLLDRHWPALTAVVSCLEDAIGDEEVDAGEACLMAALAGYERAAQERGSRASLPLLFVRVRDPGHLCRLLDRLGDLAAHLDGVVLPKFEAAFAQEYMHAAVAYQAGRERPLWVMPILEGPGVGSLETRLDTLLAVRDLLAQHADIVPCIRIGGTDLSGAWGLRRSRDHSVYQLAVVRDVIADIVNVLGRADGVPAISGAAWEWFADDPVLRPQLRETPFRQVFGEQDGPAVRRRLVSNALDGLLQETLLDRANGLHGKTAIHPSHVLPIDAAHTVSYDEWQDAAAVLEALRAGRGVQSRQGGTRMNEPKPHALWAQRITRRAEAFGVLAANRSFLSLL